MIAVQAKKVSVLLLFLAFLTSVVGTIMLFQQTTTVASALEISGERQAKLTAFSTTDPNCRLGVASLGIDQTPWLETLGAGWYLSFSDRPYTSYNPPEREFVPIIRVRQRKDNPHSDDPATYHPEYLIGIGPYHEYNGPGGDVAGGWNPDEIESRIASRVTANPGKLWLIGNETDVPSTHQGDTYPHIYAQAYHDVSHLIKQYDPTAQVGIAALSMMTPGRLQYLEMVWDAYVDLYNEPMPVDVWNLHLYIIPEVNLVGGEYEHSDGHYALGTDPSIGKLYSKLDRTLCTDTAAHTQDNVYCYSEHDNVEIFLEQLISLRVWMKEHGQQEKPLILSEFGLLLPYFPKGGGACYLQDEVGGCFTPERVNEFMTNTFAQMDSLTDPDIGYPQDNNRLIQQWLWYSTVVVGGVNGQSSYLLKQNYTDYVPGSVDALTEVGMNFLNEATTHSTYVNLMVYHAPTVHVNTDVSGTATAPIAGTFYNNGNTNITQPFNVTFYEEDRTTVIDSVTIDPILHGCARQDHTASVEWPGLLPGVHHFWMKVDAGNVISESNEANSDNMVRGTVLVDSTNLWLPVEFKDNP